MNTVTARVGKTRPENSQPCWLGLNLGGVEPVPLCLKISPFPEQGNGV